MMTKQLANPLQSLISAAAKRLPSQTGATASYHARTGASGPSVILADVSGSMATTAWGGRRKVEILREAVAGMLRPEHRLIAFSSSARETREIPEPDGGTALHIAIEHATGLRPSQTLVISDGQPDDAARALRAAEALPGVIHTLYVGPDSDRAAMDFMARLARLGTGRAQSADLRTTGPAQLTAHVNRLLALPQR